MQQGSSRTSLTETDEAKMFLHRYTPDKQLTICRNPTECITADYPELSVVARTYGEQMPVAWLIPQLTNLSEFCGAREKITMMQLRELAQMIANEYYYLKISELMLFFYRMKSGRYGRFYGTVDPMIIMEALRQFVGERNAMLEQYENEQKRKRREREMQNGITWEEFCKMQGINKKNPLER